MTIDTLILAIGITLAFCMLSIGWAETMLGWAL